MIEVLKILLPVVAGVLGIFLILKFISKAIKRNLLSEIKQRYSGTEILKVDLNANLFGFKSKGVKQIRGNGALILFKKEIRFIMAVPRKEFVIPVDKHFNADLTKSFLHKTIFKDLIKFEFVLNGKSDECAFAIVSPEIWLEEIKNLEVADKEYQPDTLH